MATQKLPPPEEDRRLQALHDRGILDTPDEERFEALIRDLAETLDAPIAYLALIDAERQWLKAKVGPIEREVPREHAFCSHTILGDEPVVVADASEDSRFASSPLVTEDPKLRFYAGVPISDEKSGEMIGTVCIADQKPRDLSARELAILKGFASRVADEVNARSRVLVAFATEDLYWVQRLVHHGEALARDRLFDLWSDLRVASGSERDWQLKDGLQRARSVVILLSNALLRSDFVQRDIFRRLLKLREVEGTEVIHILVEPCDWSAIDWMEQRPPWSPNGAGLPASDPAEIDRVLSALVARLQTGGEKRGPELPQVETAAPKLFLSHASEDAEAVRELARKLRQAGLEVWLDIDELKPGDNWMERLERALAESDAFAVYISQVGVQRWINREVRVALDRNVKDAGFRVIPILGPGADPNSLPSFLAQHQWLDLRSGDGDPTEIKRLLGTILDRPPEVVSLLPGGEAPFRGLLAFDVEHAHLFFGRDRETEELLERLRVAPFLAVIGESGSGKSSLVRAGLIPALSYGPIDGGVGQPWRTVIMRPGKDPFRELSNALPRLLADARPAELLGVREACAKQLARGTDGLCGAVGGLVPAGQRTLLVVDQFEELFTQSRDTAVRDRFIDTLVAASDDSGDRPLNTVITMRADFFSHCFEHPKLPQVISANQYPVRAMPRRQLVEVIEKPAAMAGVRLEPGLVEAILHDVGGESASLALLEHTLLELWKRRRGDGTLTHESYESIGRVKGALEHHAEDVYRALDQDERKLARKLVLHLAVPDKGGTVTRRRMARDELVPDDESGALAEQVLRQLVDQRLLTVRQGPEGGNGSTEEVEVAHEALLRGWSRLGRWLEEDREFLLWRQQTRSAYEAWEESGRDRGALLRGGPLEEARRWLEKRREDMGEGGREFLDKSIAQARMAAWARRAVMAVITLLAVAAAAAAWLADSHFELAKGALRQVGDMTEVAGQAKAGHPEEVELKRSVAEQAVEFYSKVRERLGFTRDLRLEEAKATYRLANLLGLASREGAAEEADRFHDESIEMLRELAGSDPRSARYSQELANAHYWRGHRRWKKGRPGEAEEDYREALRMQRELVESAASESDHLGYLFELGRTLNGLGILLRKDTRWAEAEESYIQAGENFERAIEGLGPSGEGDPLERYKQGRAWALTNLAELYNARGQDLEGSESDQALEEAAETYLEAIEILEELRPLGREYTLELAMNRNNRSNTLRALGRYEEAREENEEAVRILEKLAEPIPDIANELGNSYMSQGALFYGLRLDDSDRLEREAYEKARAIFERLARGPDATPQYRSRLAMVLANLADLNDGEAREELCRLLTEVEKRDYRSYCPGA